MTSISRLIHYISVYFELLLFINIMGMVLPMYMPFFRFDCACYKGAIFCTSVCSAEFLGLLCFYYLCDRTNVFASSKKVITEYSRLCPHFQAFPAVNFAKTRVLMVIFRLVDLPCNSFSFTTSCLNDLTLKCAVQHI